jgi:SAM-dependent methyltransferase
MARIMGPLAELAAAHVLKIVRPIAPAALRVLDLAAGHGLFGLQYARQYSYAQVTAQDSPAVLAVTRENAKALGIDRFTMIPGSVFDVDFGTGYDVVVLANLLHLYGEAKNVALLTKARQALKPGGIAIIIEFAPDDDRISPGSHGSFALFMLASTAEGDTFTVNELKRMCIAAGFESVESGDLAQGRQRFITAVAPCTAGNGNGVTNLRAATRQRIETVVSAR